MHPLYLVLLTLTVLLPSTATAQAPGDTLPERVVERAYEAFNRHDAAAYMSFFAPRLTLEASGRTPCAVEAHVPRGGARSSFEKVRPWGGVQYHQGGGATPFCRRPLRG
jgi:hypothetical protein